MAMCWATGRPGSPAVEPAANREANGFLPRTIDDFEHQARRTGTCVLPLPSGDRRPRLVTSNHRFHWVHRAAVELRLFIAAGWADQVLVAGEAGAVDAEVEAGIGEAEFLVEAIGGRTGVPASLTIVGPVTDRAGATPGPVTAARTSREQLLIHAGSLSRPRAR
jgi:hypothetical protein